MSEHTPGPWVIDEDEVSAFDGAVPIARVYDDADFPCVVDDENGAHQFLAPECRANARLIAAAPDAMQMADWVDYHFDDQDMSHVDFRVEVAKLARDFLAKARGEV